MAQSSLQSLKQRYPWTSIPLIVCAPMKAISGPSIAVAVSEAGGLGFIGPGAKPEDLESHLEDAENLVSRSKTLSSAQLSVLPIGFGIQTWTSDLKTTVNVLNKWNTNKSPPAAAWLFAPRDGQKELDDWTRKIRESTPSIQVWTQVASVAEALAAANSSERPDVLVIQGADAGGHSRTQGAGIVTLLPEVQDAIVGISANIPLIAAGGIGDSRGASAALALGASGVAMGTRFLATKEAQINVGYQKAVLEAWDGGQNTMRTQLYNHLRGTMDWPVEFDARGLVNQSWRDHVAGLPFEENQRLYQEASALGEQGWGKEHGRMATYAGTGVGLVRQVLGAGEVVKAVRSGVLEVVEGVIGDLSNHD
ncbi:2-nitropropane dioxygenase precursor [Tothia fuscella]|uniref:2-nitropropane dioxygenase n=1 Tax=Tothia fuscella TaxID=1048955 RepID=A0A9P4NQ12_9PEZI|nr:2-nitropropane dioxygenase precursor [Tothia fuscella]